MQFSTILTAMGCHVVMWCVCNVKQFFSFFKTLIGKLVIVELKNDLALRGILVSVDQYLNIKLTKMTVVDPKKYPHLVSVNNCFIRGSVVRYIQLPKEDVDTQLLQDSTRRAHRNDSAKEKDANKS